MVEVVYKPQSLAGTQSNAPKEIDKPEYDDVGVSFKGYSKTPLGNKEYRLNTQTPFDANFRTVAVGGETQFNYSLSQNTTSKHFITDIFFTCWPNSVNRVYLSDPSTGRIFFYVLNQNLAFIQSYSMHFSIPIQITNNQVRLVLSAAAAASDEYVINFYGWSE